MRPSIVGFDTQICIRISRNDVSLFFILWPLTSFWFFIWPESKSKKYCSKPLCMKRLVYLARYNNLFKCYIFNSICYIKDSIGHTFDKDHNMYSTRNKCDLHLLLQKQSPYLTTKLYNNLPISIRNWSNQQLSIKLGISYHPTFTTQQKKNVYIYFLTIVANLFPSFWYFNWLWSIITHRWR